MLKSLSDQNGFSIQELVMTLGLMGLLCALAIIPYNMMQNSRITTRLQAVVQNLETQVRAAQNDKGVFPPVLDQSAIGAVCQNCFAELLSYLPQEDHWFKVSDTEYLFSAKVSGTQESDFRKSKDFHIQYQPTDGQFVIQQIP